MKHRILKTPSNTSFCKRTFTLIQLLVGISISLLASGCGQAAEPGLPTTPTHMEAMRKRMVDRQLKAPGRGIRNPRVLQAMGKVPRHEFVPLRIRLHAYLDRPLSIGYRQTISQPYIVAFMTEQLDPQLTDKILEIGTGSGYQAAVLSGLVKEVYTIEIVEALAKRSKETLARLGYANVKTKFGDGYKGWPEEAPFDAVIVTCSPKHVPQPLVDQLKEGGKMIIPVGDAGSQRLYLLKKEGGQIKQTAILDVRFVPMTGEAESKSQPDGK